MAPDEVRARLGTLAKQVDQLASSITSGEQDVVAQQGKYDVAVTDVERLRKIVRNLRKAKVVSLPEWKLVSAELERADQILGAYRNMTKAKQAAVAHDKKTLDKLNTEKADLQGSLDSMGQIIKFKAPRRGKRIRRNP